jgi:hypothetical protein
MTTELVNAGMLRVFTPFDPLTLNMGPNENDPDIPTFGYGYVSSGGETFGGYGSRFQPQFFLMKGAVPTQAELNTGEIAASRTLIPNDVLVNWSTNGPAGSWINSGTSLYLSATALSYASASGTATWLYWRSYAYSGGFGTPGKYPEAVFTVGLFGSGSDFELPTTDIISGRGYKLVNGPRLIMATEFNY